MSDPEYLKCPCKECGNNIEYPASAARDTVPCPHCGEWTELPAPEENADEEPVTRSLMAVAVLVLIPLAVLAGGAYFLMHQSNKPAKAPETAAAPVPVKKPTPVPASVPPPMAETTNPPVPAEKRPKSPGDLVVSRVKLEKMKGTSVVHVVGTIKNNSAYERFRVKIIFDLINKQGVRIGSAEDQKSVIEPNDTWKFQALVADRQAATASVASVTEEE